MQIHVLLLCAKCKLERFIYKLQAHKFVVLIATIDLRFVKSKQPWAQCYFHLF